CFHCVQLTMLAETGCKGRRVLLFISIFSRKPASPSRYRPLPIRQSQRQITFLTVTYQKVSSIEAKGSRFNRLGKPHLFGRCPLRPFFPWRGAPDNLNR